MRKINILLAAICVVLMTSCSGLLDKKPTNQADSSTTIMNTTDAQVMINGVMSKMLSSSYYGRNFLLWGDGRSGDVTTVSAGNGGDGYYYYNHEVNSNSYEGFWSTMYNDLLQINNIITNLVKLKAESENATTEYDDFLGQAYTLRAMVHFDLVRLYGKPYNMDKGASLGVPVVTEIVNASEQRTRNTVAEVYTQIVKDLLAGAELISKDKSNGYINYYGNQALLAKVYLYMENWDGAQTAAENVINSGVYELYTPAKWVDSWKGQFGTESIFELAVLETENDLGNSSPGAYYRRQKHGSSSIVGVFVMSKYWIDLMDDADVRLGVHSHDIMVEEEAANYGWRGEKGCCYKYSGGTNLQGDGKSTSSSVNIKVIRLSEVVLNAAEAALNNGQAAKAAEYLNMIAQRNPNYTPWTAATVTSAEIMKERRRELITEGVVFFERMRLNETIYFDDNAFNKGTNPPQSGRGSLPNKAVTRDFNKIILPIGQHEINANPNIAEQQNPGY